MAEVPLMPETLLVLLILALGIALLVHDLIVHLTGRLAINRPVYVGRVRIHHGYVGLLMIVGALLYLLLI